MKINNYIIFYDDWYWKGKKMSASHKFHLKPLTWFLIHQEYVRDYVVCKPIDWITAASSYKHDGINVKEKVPYTTFILPSAVLWSESHLYILTKFGLIWFGTGSKEELWRLYYISLLTEVLAALKIYKIFNSCSYVDLTSDTRGHNSYD